MSYLVIARKWRPQVLADLLGQEHVAQTLTNAIESGRIAHAFLFSGPRGVGKTSAARILAKALCCTATDGPNPTPCGQCAQCQQITEGSSEAVREIDAASHTGVDDIREIIENVRFLPAGARYKTYVIDEVHMLSKSAFNALLKTLEEPPAHVKFILATTDPQKIPVTILSRCQRYDFKRIPLSKIAARLSYILKQEGVEHEPSALNLLAREAEGSMRDAQSLLEQVLAFAGDRPLDAPLLRDALGVVDARMVREAFAALLAREPATLIEQVAELYNRGLDLKHFAGALIEHARQLLVARVVPAPEKLLDLPSDEVRELVAQAKPHGPETFERLYEQLCRVAEEVDRARYPRFSLEIGLAGLAEAPPAANLPHLIEQLGRVEARLAGVSNDALRASGRGQQRPANRARSPASRAGRGVEDPAGEEPHPAPPSKPAQPPPKPTARASDPDEPPPPSDQDWRGGPDGGEEPPPAGPSYEDFVKQVQADRPALVGALREARPIVFSAAGVRLAVETDFHYKQLSDLDRHRDLEGYLKALFHAPVRLTIERKAAEGATQSLNEKKASELSAREAAAQKEALAHPAVARLKEDFGATIKTVRVPKTRE